jgi:iron(III) transport system ATP-binding protein
MSSLILDGVSRRFGATPAVDELSLTIEPGEIVCLLGPSGCGKSTTLRIAAGLETLEAGKVLIGGEEVARPGWQLPPEARNVGLVFQDYALFPHLSVAENVAFGLNHMDSGQKSSRVAMILARLGMEARGDDYPHTLSGGEQQRVALARAMAPEPGLMLMDEPFSDLDTRLRERTRADALAVLRDAEVATLLVTHDPDEAMRMADRIALMRAGRLIQLAEPSDLYHRPANRFAASFLADINELQGVVEAGSAKTPLGEVTAAGYAEGARVDVLVRPEGVLLDGEGHCGAEVIAARSLGAYSVIEARLDEGQTVRSRLPISDPPAEGARVNLRLDPSKAFVFEAKPLD